VSQEKVSLGRKVLLVNPRFQFQFMAWMGGLAVAVVMVLHLAHDWFFYQLREQARLAGLTPDHVFFQFINSRQTELNLISVVSFVAILFVVGIIGLILSHRIAGPMYRMKLHFEEVAKTGVAKRLKFREGDFFLEIPDAYNLQFNKNEETDTSVRKSV